MKQLKIIMQPYMKRNFNGHHDFESAFTEQFFSLQPTVKCCRKSLVKSSHFLS